MGTASIEDVAAAAPNGRNWFQLYLWTDRDRSLELIERAAKAGNDTLMVTVDTAVAGARLRDVRNGMTIPPALTLKTVLDASYRPAWWFNFLTHEPLTFGRHLIVGYRDPAELRALVERSAIGGIFLSGRNVRGRSAQQIGQEIGGLQEIRRRLGRPPLWIAVDQEGGLVSRLSPPLTRTKSLADVTAPHHDAQGVMAAVRDVAATHGRELAAVGVNLNFAPVVDLNHRVVNPNDRYTRIHQRAISSDPQRVVQIADLYCAVLAESGVHCTPKHFPGLGRVFEDTHQEGADLLTPPRELAATDWVPFRALARRPDAFMMLGHARLAAVDPQRPVSFSHAVVAGVLRGDWRYDGVLVTDDFCMEAVYGSRQGMTAASVEALNAGVDLILIAFDPDQYYPVMHALLRARTDGLLRPDALATSEARLRRAIHALPPGTAAPLSP
jgi:beta-N-acetylhexosaminidase